MKRTPATPQELLARRNAVLAYITDHIGQVLPFSRTIAFELGCTTAQIDHAFRMLSSQGTITCVGNGNGRVIIVDGVGETLPRHAGKEVAGRVERMIEPEPVRVFNYTCQRCGGRNCLRHGQMSLTTRPLPAFMRVA